MRTSRLLHALLAGWMLGAGGCVTSQMWNDANETAVDFNQIRSDAAMGDYHEIMVSYCHNTSEHTVIFIPLLPDGRPAAPFAYTGRETSADAILKDIPPTQRSAILRAAGEVHDWTSPPTTRPGDDYSTGGGCDCGADTATDGTLILAAYKIVDGHLMPIDLRWDPTVKPRAEYWPYPGDHRLPRDGFVVVVPAKRTRLAQAHANEQLQSVALTPVTLAADAFDFGIGLVVYPAVFVIVAVTGYHGC